MKMNIYFDVFCENNMLHLIYLYMIKNPNDLVIKLNENKLICSNIMRKMMKKI